MSRDKCGAAAAAGVMATVNMLQPQGVKVVSAMAMVRNSVGSDCYVADEIITSRAGVRIRVGNTDAEGRMAMVDVLCHAKEKALKDPSKEYFATQLVPYLHASAARPPDNDDRDLDRARGAGRGSLLLHHGQRAGQGCGHGGSGAGRRGQVRVTNYNGSK